MRRGTKYKFNIWNFTKPKSLFNDGMKPVWYSKKKQKHNDIENEEDAWEFIPDENIVESFKYAKSNLKRSSEPKGLFEKLFVPQQKSNS